MFPCNKALTDLLTLVKTETMEMIEMINSVKIWVQLNIPRIEDGARRAPSQTVSDTCVAQATILV